MKEDSNISNILKIPYKFDSRYVFEDSLNRIFRLVGEVKQLEELINNSKLPYIFSDTQDPIKFEYDIKEISAFDSYKEISWLLIYKPLLTDIKITFNLTENTLENTVLVVFEISFIHRELIPDKYKKGIIESFEGVTVDILNNMIIKLKNDNKDIYHYESKIFNYSREKCLDIFLSLDEIMKERGCITNVNRFGEKNKEGEIISFNLEDQKEIKIKITKLHIDKNDYKWVINYMPLDLNYKDYIVEYIFIKINDDETLLIVNNLYYELIEASVKKKLSEQKQSLFQTVEEELRKKYH